MTWLPRCSAVTPSRRSISARFWPYWPNSTEAWRLSSKSSAALVGAPSTVGVSPCGGPSGGSGIRLLRLRRGIRPARLARALASAPIRLLPATSVIVTGAISPINDVGAMTGTGCRYGERPTIWPGWRPGLSNSTSKVIPTQRAMNAACWRSISFAGAAAARPSPLSGSCSMSAAGVPGRGEYLNENALAKPTS